MNSMVDMQAVYDSQQVIAATIAMATLADRREWAALEKLFTPQILADYTALNGGKAEAVAAADLVAGWKQALAAFRATQHIVSNHEVTLQGNHAEATAYFQATHSKPDGKLWILGGTYRYGLERHAGRWLIARVVMIPLWSREATNTLG